MDPWPLEPTHHVTWKVLIGSSNLYNKIKAKVLRQRAVFPWVTYYYCFSTRAVALPGWCYGHSPNNNPPLSPRPSQDLKQQQHLLLIVHPFYRNNQKCITQGFWYFARLRTREIQAFPRNPVKFPKKREIPRNPQEIFPSTCRQNIFNTYLGY